MNPFSVGQQVNIEGLRGTFEILEGPNRKNQYRVGLKGLTLWVDGEKLRLCTARTSKKRKKQTADSSALSGGTRSIDLHGMNIEQARELLTKTLDQAVLDHVERLEIIHGLGTGAIRELVQQMLSNYPHVASFSRDEQNPGVTNAWF